MTNHFDGRHVGARVCLVSDSTRRGVIESSQAKGGFWGVRFADQTRNIRVADLKLLPSDASFELSQAPPSGMERQASAYEYSKRGLYVAVSTNDALKGPIILFAGKSGPVFVLGVTRRGAASSSHKALMATGPHGLPTRAATSAWPTSMCCYLTPPRSNRRKLP